MPKSTSPSNHSIVENSTLEKILSDLSSIKAQESLAEERYQQISEKITITENRLEVANEENRKRLQDIKTLAKHLKVLATEDEEESENEANPEILRASQTAQAVISRTQRVSDLRPPSRSSTPDSMESEHALDEDLNIVQTQHRAETRHASRENNFKFQAKELIRTIEILRGKDDVGTKDFIRGVQRARNRCSQPELLLDFILTEKIQDNAKRAIRYIRIRSYEELYDALNKNVAVTTSVETSRSRLDNIRQQPTETVQSYTLRFRQQLNELKYAVQSEHSNTRHRAVAMEIEEKSATKRYVMNLRDELGSQVRTQRPKDVNAAYQEALEAECWTREKQAKGRAVQRSDHQRTQGRSPTIDTIDSAPRTTTHTMPLADRLKYKIFCNICKRNGHTEANCFSKTQEKQNFHEVNHPTRPPQNNNEVRMTTTDLNEENSSLQEENQPIDQEETEYQPCPEDCNQYQSDCGEQVEKEDY